MNIEHIEHIALYKEVYPAGYCQHLISEFNRLEQNGAGSNRQNAEGVSRHHKDDHLMFLNLRNHNMVPFNDKDSVDMFFDGLQNCYDSYCRQYSILKTQASIRATVMKM
jgi:hypothetical protein